MDLQNSFTAAKSSKFPAKPILGYPPHLKVEVGLGPGHIVLDGDSAPFPKKGAEPPIFGSFVIIIIIIQFVTRQVPVSQKY